MIRTYRADLPFRVRLMPTSVGVADGQRAAEIRVADLASLDAAMVSKSRPHEGYTADRITRGGDHIVVWPLRALSPGDTVWLDENSAGGLVTMGVAVAFFRMNDRMDRLRHVRPDGDDWLQAVPEKLLRPID